MPISGKTACEIAAAGLGMTYMAFASGVTGGTLTAPAMLAGGAFGYLLGKAVCKIPALNKAFDRALGTHDWAALDLVLTDPSIRAEAVALISDEVGVPESRAEQIWDALIFVVKKDPKGLVGGASFEAARHHPPTGQAKHGIADLQITSGVTA